MVSNCVKGVLSVLYVKVFVVNAANFVLFCAAGTIAFFVAIYLSSPLEVHVYLAQR